MADNLKIIFDVNIWVSAVIGKKVEQQVQAIILRENVEIIVCTQLLEELEQTLQKPKLQKYISSERVKLAMDLVKLSSIVVNPYSTVKLCRDSKDDYLLALAKDAQVDFLLTGDEDLLVLKHFEKTRIMNLADYSILVEIVHWNAKAQICKWCTMRRLGLPLKSLGYGDTSTFSYRWR